MKIKAFACLMYPFHQYNQKKSQGDLKTSHHTIFFRKIPFWKIWTLCKAYFFKKPFVIGKVVFPPNSIKLEADEKKQEITFICMVSLKSLSSDYFRYLQKSGWEINKENAKRNNVPNQEKDKYLQKDIAAQERLKSRFLRTP